MLTTFMMEQSIVLAELTGVIEDAAVTRRRKNPKRTGELSEAAFLLKAQTMGFRVLKPWGDSERYDFVLDSGGRLWRVQLKSTAVVHARGYEVQPIYSVYRGAYGRGKAGYTADEIDVLAVHIRPRDVWYVLPVEVIALSKNLRFYPDIECKCARWESYREAWSVMGVE
ncbi:MAG TPA: group I intron-associated PD-(D/E)XK endonuclease [Terriglobales bacterium]|nr:group I intron-associated PD-(D/E)XK endonuclease [Terriglobales bacterium]